MNQTGPSNAGEREDKEPSSASISSDAVEHTFSPLRMRSAPFRQVARMQTFLRRWVMILGCAVGGAMLGFLLTIRMLPVYQARTTLDVQSIDTGLMTMPGAAPGLPSAGTGQSSDLQTQIKLLQSTTVLDRTVKRLQSEPQPPTLDREDIVSNLLGMLGLSHGKNLPYSALVEDAATRVRVVPLGMTRLVEITCESWNARLSADFCNTLAEEFKAIDLENRRVEAQKSSDLLMLRVAEIRQRVEDSQRKLQSATAGGVEPATLQPGNSVREDRLRQIQDELVTAEADRIEKDAQLLAATKASPGSTPESLNDPTYREYQQRLVSLKKKEASLVPPLTGKNREVIHLRSQIHKVEDAMVHERAAALARLRQDFATARHHEDLLNATYASLAASVTNISSKTENVDQLRRELDSEQQLYQTLLQRVGEVGLASSVHSSTTRIVDPAMPETSPVWPRRGMATLAGLCFGALVGLGLAFFKERNANVFRMPGEAEVHLQLHELGIIPSAGISELPGMPSRGVVSTSDSSKADVQLSAIQSWDDRFSIVSEAYRNAAHSVLLSGGTTPRRSRAYILTSADIGEGKTTTVANLAIAFSKSNLRVVMVDADLRSPSLHKTMRVENIEGLRKILRGYIDVSTAPLTYFCIRTTIPNLSIIPAGTGTEEVVELLHSSATSSLFARLAAEFDVVLIDSPPILHMADARILATHTDGVILVLRAGVTQRDLAANACDLLKSDRVPLVGVLLNDFDPAREGKKDYYRSYYQYREQIRAAEKTASRP